MIGVGRAAVQLLLHSIQSLQEGRLGSRKEAMRSAGAHPRDRQALCTALKTGQRSGLLWGSGFRLLVRGPRSGTCRSVVRVTVGQDL